MEISLEETRKILSPGLVVSYELLEQNLEEMIRIAGGVERLRPHCKTHKIQRIVELQLERGIDKHKCATFAEAEMLALAGVQDVFLAYNLVGPNLHRAVAFRQRFPQVRFAVTADHPVPIEQLSAAMAEAGERVDVLLDVDTGQHRTGLEVGPRARELYAQIVSSEGLTAAGLHVYDGQNHQTDLGERRAAVEAGWQKVRQFRAELEDAGLPVPRIVAGGTGSFPVYAEFDDPGLELSPGTSVFFDAGYGRLFPDLKFVPAAELLTRVISCPTPTTVTCDLGYKACASDPPAGQRLVFPDLPDARQILQNEEHLVLETERAATLRPGDVLWAIPRHICPTSALHRAVDVVREGRVWESWPVTARDRQLSI